MTFQPSFTWSYDPFGIIYDFRVDLKMTPYNHNPRPEIEKFTNQEQWVDGTLQEEEVIDMIKALNSKSREELEGINIPKKIATILEIKKVLQKRSLIKQLETKCQTLDVVVQRFHSKFNVVNQKGLP